MFWLMKDEQKVCSSDDRQHSQGSGERHRQNAANQTEREQRARRQAQLHHGERSARTSRLHAAENSSRPLAALTEQTVSELEQHLSRPAARAHF